MLLPQFCSQCRRRGKTGAGRLAGWNALPASAIGSACSDIYDLSGRHPFAVLFNYRSLQQPDLRLRTRWFAFGIVAGLGPNVAVSLWRLRHVAPSSGSDELFYYSDTDHACLCHRETQAISESELLRRGLQYILATGSGLRHIAACSALVIQIAINPNVTVADLISKNRIFLCLLIVSAICLPFRKRILCI